MNEQALKYHFVECENRMWLISERKLPIGVQFETANDWIMLHYSFVNYILKTQDEHFHYLTNFMHNTLLSAETFYNTIIINSPFCDKIIDVGLRAMNFQKEGGGRSCQCDKPMVDWCGCSPIFYKTKDFNRLKVRLFDFLYIYKKVFYIEI